jgi:hypothetical protein
LIEHLYRKQWAREDYEDMERAFFCVCRLVHDRRSTDGR